MIFIRNLVFGTAIALFGGFASAHYAIDYLGKSSNLSTGQWTRLESIENTAGNPYRAALKVRTTGVALAPGEGLVFTSERDVNGERFDAQCRYMLSGKIPKAALWTLSINVDEADQTIGHAERRFMVSQSVQWKSDGTLEVAISPEMQSGNWIAAPDEGTFSISLRLYDTPLALNTQETSIQDLPQIIRGSCI